MAPKDGTNRDVEVRTEAMGRRRMGSEDEKSLAAEFMVNFFLENSKGGGIPGQTKKTEASSIESRYTTRQWDGATRGFRRVSGWDLGGSRALVGGGRPRGRSGCDGGCAKGCAD